MIRTGYFARHGRYSGAVSIARFPPDWFTGPRCYTLAPPPALLRLQDQQEYRERYCRDVLDRIDPDELIRELEVLAGGPDIILLCFERDRSHCHRGLVAEWFRKKKGMFVYEAGEEGQQTL